MWMAWSVADEEQSRKLRGGTGPHWKKPDDARIALAMLREDDEAMVEVLGRYAEHHITPALAKYEEGQRIERAFGSLVAEPSDVPDAIGHIPPEVYEAAIEAGLLEWCEEHGRFETATGVTAEQAEEFARSQDRRGFSPEGGNSAA